MLWRGRRPGGPVRAVRRDSGFVSVRLPPPPCPPAGLFGGPPAARAGMALFRLSWGGRARAVGGGRRGLGGCGLGARRLKGSPAPRAHRLASPARGRGRWAAGGGQGRVPLPRGPARGAARAPQGRAAIVFFSPPHPQDELASFLFSAMEFSLLLALQSQRNPRQQMPIRSV